MGKLLRTLKRVSRLSVHIKKLAGHGRKGSKLVEQTRETTEELNTTGDVDIIKSASSREEPELLEADPATPNRNIEQVKELVEYCEILLEIVDSKSEETKILLDQNKDLRDHNDVLKKSCNELVKNMSGQEAEIEQLEADKRSMKSAVDDLLITRDTALNHASKQQTIIEDVSTTNNNLNRKVDEVLAAHKCTLNLLDARKVVTDGLIKTNEDLRMQLAIELRQKEAISDDLAKKEAMIASLGTQNQSLEIRLANTQTAYDAAVELIGDEKSESEKLQAQNHQLQIEIDGIQAQLNSLDNLEKKELIRSANEAKAAADGHMMKLIELQDSTEGKLPVSFETEKLLAIKNTNYEALEKRTNAELASLKLKVAELKGSEEIYAQAALKLGRRNAHLRRKSDILIAETGSNLREMVLDQDAENRRLAKMLGESESSVKRQTEETEDMRKKILELEMKIEQSSIDLMKAEMDCECLKNEAQKIINEKDKRIGVALANQRAAEDNMNAVVAASANQALQMIMLAKDAQISEIKERVKYVETQLHAAREKESRKEWMSDMDSMVGSCLESAYADSCRRVRFLEDLCQSNGISPFEGCVKKLRFGIKYDEVRKEIGEAAENFLDTECF